MKSVFVFSVSHSEIVLLQAVVVFSVSVWINFIMQRKINVVDSLKSASNGGFFVDGVAV